MKGFRKRGLQEKRRAANAEGVIMACSPITEDSSTQPSESRLKTAGRKMVKRRDRKAYRTIQKQKTKLHRWKNNKVKMLQRKIKNINSKKNELEISTKYASKSPKIKQQNM